MMKTSLIAFLSILLLAFTCEGDKKEKKAGNMEAELNEVIDKNVPLAKDFEGKLDELLTLEMAAETSGYPAAEAKIEPDDEISKKYNKFSISYSWDKTNRTTQIEVMGRKIDAPKTDKVELSWVKNTTLEAFKNENKNPTAADIENANEAIDKKIGELNAEGKATKQQTDAGSNMAKNAMKKFISESVEGVGECAFFTNTKFAGVPIRDLKVFHNDLSFQIMVDLSDDKSVNDAKAIALAKKIITEKL